MEQLPPIPIPRRHRWREFRIKKIPVVTFCAALVAVGFIWREHVVTPSFIGEVETIRANVISTLPGLLVEMTAERFDQVSKGQVIGKILPADPELLKASLAAIEIDLRTLQARVALDQDRNALSYEQLRLDWLSQRVELATAKVNLQFAESEYQRSAKLHGEKILSDSLYELAKDLRDVRREEVTEKAKVVSEMESRLKALNVSEGSPASRTNTSLAQAIAAQEAQLLLTEGPVTLKAPIDGVISSLNHRSGERVMAGLPIVTVTSAHASRIVAFARQPLEVIPKEGDRVRVRTRGNPRKTAIASVLHVGSAVELMVVPAGNNNKGDLNTLLGNPLERGLAFSVSMPEGMTIYPGEAVDLVLIR